MIAAILDRLSALLRKGWALIRDLWDLIKSLLARVANRTAVNAPIEEAPKPELSQITNDESRDDETALARMLASEDRNEPIKIVIGWNTVQKQKANKKTLFDMLTKGLGYGPQDRRESNQGIMYASTAKRPSPADRALARGIISGSLRPSAAIRAHKPGGWVERGQGTSDERLIALQDSWKEGIYAQIANSKWVLYSADQKKVTVPKGTTASKILDSLPVVNAVDSIESENAA